MTQLTDLSARLSADPLPSLEKYPPPVVGKNVLPDEGLSPTSSTAKQRDTTTRESGVVNLPSARTAILLDIIMEYDIARAV